MKPRLNKMPYLYISEKPLPKWKSVTYWFCGYNPDERESLPEDNEMITSIAEEPKWRKFVFVNMIILNGIAFYFMGLYW